MFINILNDEVIQGNKLICEFLGCKVEYTYENKTTGYIEYTIKGNLVEQWRANGLSVFGFQTSMSFSNCKFHKCWSWIMWLREYLELKDIYITLDYSADLKEHYVNLFQIKDNSMNIKILIKHKNCITGIWLSIIEFIKQTKK